MDRLPLQALAAFHEVVRHGGVRAAARHLGIAHSAVSRRLCELERAAGAPLLQPRRHPGDAIGLTRRGQEIADAAEAAFARLHLALHRERRPAHARELVVSTTESFATRWLLPRLPAFRQAHPRTRISVSVRSDLVDLSREQVDIALRMGAGPWPNARPWMDDALVPVASPSLLRRRTPWPLKTLRDLPLLHDHDPNAAWSRWRDGPGPATLDVSQGQSFPSSHLVIEAAAQGLGVALARRRLARRELDSGVLVQPFGPYEIPLPQAYWIVMPGNGKVPAALERFVDWLQARAGD
ncbi:LysR substrate-binding domain-containing protein [Pseudoxanthomonas sp. Soil82]|uniref:LysR substrate-binding domain-containing protein n=1 Tax=Pseudoxanthomonas sp. Soil82 TaxID=3157341 RepID=UPI00338E0599